jgi:hypothetical protein
MCRNGDRSSSSSVSNNSSRGSSLRYVFYFYFFIIKLMFILGTHNMSKRRGQRQQRQGLETWQGMEMGLGTKGSSRRVQYSNIRIS